VTPTEPPENRDPGRVPIAERWGPVAGRQPTGSGPSFRRRWLAAIICMLILIGVIALLG